MSKLILCIGGLLLILFCSNIGFAALCGFKNPKDAFAEADAVFLGKVIKISGSWDKDGAFREYTIFQVEQTWKGNLGNEVRVAFDYGAWEPLRREPSEPLLVYATKLNREYKVDYHKCDFLLILSDSRFAEYLTDLDLRSPLRINRDYLIFSPTSYDGPLCTDTIELTAIDRVPQYVVILIFSFITAFLFIGIGQLISKLSSRFAK